MSHSALCSHAARQREAGIALLASVLLLLMLASIGLAALNVVERDQQVAGYLNRKAIALHAADAAVARALGTLIANGTPTVPNTTMGDASLYPGGQPSYRTDTTAANPIQKAGTGGVPGMGLTGGMGGSGAAYSVQYWKIRVQGEAPGGSIARVEVLTGSLVAN
jgi:Tfp pilus assembly protein PilX